MTPQERQLVDDLFDRLAKLEASPRDADAERAIADGLRRAPNAVYALVQTVLVQDEALKRADAHIRELSGDQEASQQGAGFLDSMREAFLGRTRGSVPSVPLGAGGPETRWNQSGAYQSQNAPGAQATQGAGFGGGSFLGTAAASAAGVIGGALLLNTISSMFGNHGSGQAFASTPNQSPWDNNNASNSDLAREAGLNDVGGRGAGNDAQQAGFFGNDNDSDYSDDFADESGDFDGGDTA